jgi:hypothetical protein
MMGGWVAAVLRPGFCRLRSKPKRNLDALRLGKSRSGTCRQHCRRRGKRGRSDIGTNRQRKRTVDCGRNIDEAYNAFGRTGEAVMPIVVVKLPRGAANLSSEMTNMRLWLDAHHCSPSRFHYDLLREGAVVQVEFSSEQEADAFKERFDAPQNGSRRRKRPAQRETMEQVCWWRLTAEEIRTEADGFRSQSARKTMSQIALSYDRLAEDLEKRLSESRYRHGLIVS